MQGPRMTPNLILNIMGLPALGPCRLCGPVLPACQLGHRTGEQGRSHSGSPWPLQVQWTNRTEAGLAHPGNNSNRVGKKTSQGRSRSSRRQHRSSSAQPGKSFSSHRKLVLAFPGRRPQAQCLEWPYGNPQRDLAQTKCSCFSACKGPRALLKTRDERPTWPS